MELLRRQNCFIWLSLSRD